MHQLILLLLRTSVQCPILPDTTEQQLPLLQPLLQTNKYMSNPAGTAMYQHTSLHFLLVRTNPIPHRSTVGAKV